MVGTGQDEGRGWIAGLGLGWEVAGALQCSMG